MIGRRFQRDRRRFPARGGPSVCCDGTGRLSPRSHADGDNTHCIKALRVDVNAGIAVASLDGRTTIHRDPNQGSNRDQNQYLQAPWRGHAGEGDLEQPTEGDLGPARQRDRSPGERVDAGGGPGPSVARDRRCATDGSAGAQGAARAARSAGQGHRPRRAGQARLRQASAVAVRRKPEEANTA